MPGVNRLDRQTIEFLQAGMRSHAVVHDRIQSGSVGIGKQIAAEKVSTGGQDADRSFGVPWNAHYCGAESEFRQIESVLDQDIRGKSVCLVESEEDRDQYS